MKAAFELKSSHVCEKRSKCSLKANFTSSVHRPECCDISGNFKRTPSAKFETMISEPRPKKGKKTAKTVQNGLRFSRFRSNCIKIISVSISILYRKDVNKNTKLLLTL